MSDEPSAIPLAEVLRAANEHLFRFLQSALDRLGEKSSRAATLDLTAIHG
jgi:hypothetical protein